MVSPIQYIRNSYQDHKLHLFTAGVTVALAAATITSGVVGRNKGNELEAILGGYRATRGEYSTLSEPFRMGILTRDGIRSTARTLDEMGDTNHITGHLYPVYAALSSGNNPDQLRDLIMEHLSPEFEAKYGGALDSLSTTEFGILAKSVVDNVKPEERGSHDGSVTPAYINRIREALGCVYPTNTPSDSAPWLDRFTDVNPKGLTQTEVRELAKGAVNGVGIEQDVTAGIQAALKAIASTKSDEGEPGDYHGQINAAYQPFEDETDAALAAHTTIEESQATANNIAIGTLIAAAVSGIGSLVSIPHKKRKRLGQR
jgi:hypothetical protein